MLLSIIGGILLLAIFLFGHVLNTFPIKSLGENTGGGSSTQCWGYDPIRGQFPRFCIFIFCLSSIALIAMFSPLISAIITIASAAWMLLGSPVSLPSGPRPGHQSLRRSPKWADRDNTLPVTARCEVSAMSHQQTREETGVTLTGVASGRQTWHANDSNPQPSPTFVFNPSINPNSSDLPFRTQQISKWTAAGKPLPTPSTPTTPLEAARKGMQYFQMLLTEDGHWAGDYGGPHFLTPGLVISWYVTGKSEAMLPPWKQHAISWYLRCHQQEDGGWGTHIESPSTMFGSVLAYTALRLMGADANDPAMLKGKQFIHSHGGALFTSSWAKLYLCMLGVMEWEGHNSIPAELWVLPTWFPLHPSRMWCHCRMVYLPMSYLYGVRFTYPKCNEDPLITSLRQELYTQSYASIEWDKTRQWVADIDNYSPLTLLMRTLQGGLALWERHGGALRRFIRNKGLNFAFEYIQAEDRQTNFIDIGPVNKVLNLIAVYHRLGDTSPQFVNHIARVSDYLWMAEDGMKMQGYNGSQCWDTSFAAQALVETGLVGEFEETANKVYGYLKDTQILSTSVARQTEAFHYEQPHLRKKYFRHLSEGGWPFSTSAHGWPIADCTAEGLKAVLHLSSHLPMKDKTLLASSDDTTLISPERLQKACDVLLSYQNEDGGWATYENNRGFGWLELLNPSEVFGDIMIDYSYVECSTAVMTALVDFRATQPLYRAEDISKALANGKKFLKSIQREDGSWYGSWACCFTYATWFGIEGLIAAGEPLTSSSITRATTFLLSHQLPNGGWGEDFTSCYNKAYAANGMERFGSQGSGVVCTSWALLGLMKAGCQDRNALARGVEFVMASQLPSGDWAQEGILGVFNRACGISYTSYRNVFPIWALGRYAHYQPEAGLQAKMEEEDTKEVVIGSGVSQQSGLDVKGLGAILLSVGFIVTLGKTLKGNAADDWPSPVGLIYGLLAVMVAQLGVVAYYIARRKELLGPMEMIQKGQPLAPHSVSLFSQIAKHLANPEGFVILASYLSITWMLNLMPASYYDMTGTVNWLHVLVQLLVMDLCQYLMHRIEHSASAWFYRLSHKPHHAFTSPRLTDAFDGSLLDTLVMILIPLYITARVVHCNVWSYMAFGASFSSLLCLLHTEFTNPWDAFFNRVGVMTSSDHHVHHRLFVWNYAHMFTYWDRLFGTYKSPSQVKGFSCYQQPQTVHT